MKIKVSTHLKAIVIVLLAFSLVSTLSVFWHLQKMELDGRVVNYAGIVRGKTQRLIKLEIEGQPHDELIASLDNIINGLINGDKKVLLPKPTDAEFISRMRDVARSWGALKESIYRARQDKHYDSILRESETYFDLTNKAVFDAEAFSKRKVNSLKTTQAGLLLLNIFLLYSIWLMSKRSELELKLVNDELNQIFNVAAEGIVVIDKYFNISRINDTLLSMLGLSRGAVSGRKCFEIFPSCSLCHTVTCPMKRTLSGEENFEIETEKTRRDGARFPVIVKSAPFRNPKGELIGIVESIRDISERKKAEEILIKTRNLESIGLLAGGIAHDFNNLLQGVFGYISLAKKNADKREQVSENLEQAEKALNMSINLARQLLTFSKGGSPVKKKLDILPVVENSAKFALSGSRSCYKLSYGNDLWTVKADEGQLAQVIQNIVLNADEAMPEGGTINISVYNMEILSGDKLIPDGGKFAAIVIEDSGIGISQESLSKIFDPYFTTKPKGSGLGLASSYSIIKNHGGTIDVKSDGKGTIFTIYLPASDDQIEEVSQPITIVSGRKGRILVMDDEEIIRSVATEMLQSFGHEAIDAQDGEEAIKKYAETVKSGNPFDIAILDLTVKGGMGGEQVAVRLREINPAVKIIVSSGYSGSDIVSNYRGHGFDAVLNKPYTIEALRNCLAGLLQP